MGKIMKNGTNYSIGAPGAPGESVAFNDMEEYRHGTLRTIYSDSQGGNQTIEFGFYNDEDERTYYKEITIPSSGGGSGGTKPVRSITNISQNTDTLTKIFPTGTFAIGNNEGLFIHFEGTVECSVIGESDSVSGTCEFDVYVPHSSINQYMWHNVTVPVTAKTQGGTIYQCSFDATVRVDDNQGSTGTTVVVMLTEDALASKITASAITSASVTDITFKASTSVTEVMTICTDSIY